MTERRSEHSCVFRREFNVGLAQWFPNYGSRPKSGSRSLFDWVAGSLSETKFYFICIAALSCAHDWQCSEFQAQAQNKLKEKTTLENQNFKEAWSLYLSGSQTMGRDPKVGREASGSGSRGPCLKQNFISIIKSHFLRSHEQRQES